MDIPLYNEVKPGQIFPPSKTITNFSVALVNDLIRQLNETGDLDIVTSKQFGAVGDGVADDTQALQDFADFVCSTGQGFGIILPGSYKTTAPITFDFPNDIQRRGVFAYGARIRPDNALVNEAVIFKGFKADIYGLTVYQNDDGIATAGIVLDSCVEIMLHACYVLMENSAAVPTYDAYLMRMETKDDIGLANVFSHCRATTIHASKIRSSFHVQGSHNASEIHHCIMARSDSGIILTYSPLADDPGDTYYGYVSNGMMIHDNIFDNQTRCIEHIGISGANPSRPVLDNIYSNRAESCTTFYDLTNVDTSAASTDEAPNVFGNTFLAVTNKIVNPNHLLLNTDLSGSYSPVLTAVANISATTTRDCRYFKEGKIVRVTGVFEAQATAGAATNTSMGIDLPPDYPMDISSSIVLYGIAASGTALGSVPRIVGDASNNRAQAQWISDTTVNLVFSFYFEYPVL